MRIFTIGYEGATVAEFLAALQDAGVERVIDVRAVPQCRAVPAFPRRRCATRWPKRDRLRASEARSGRRRKGRAAARAGRQTDLERIYAGQLELPEAMAQSAQMLELAAEKPSALLCYERDPAHCHRTLLLDAVAADARGRHLYRLNFIPISRRNLRTSSPVLPPGNR